jgi:hypothetical protein
MGKYDPLYDYLKRRSADMYEVTLTFEHIAVIIDASLPASAFRYREWWANERGDTSHVQARAWLAAGWYVDEVQQDEGWVRFKREVV